MPVRQALEFVRIATGPTVGLIVAMRTFRGAITANRQRQANGRIAGTLKHCRRSCFTVHFAASDLRMLRVGIGARNRHRAIAVHFVCIVTAMIVTIADELTIDALAEWTAEKRGGTLKRSACDLITAIRTVQNAIALPAGGQTLTGHATEFRLCRRAIAGRSSNRATLLVGTIAAVQTLIANGIRIDAQTVRTLELILSAARCVIKMRTFACRFIRVVSTIGMSVAQQSARNAMRRIVAFEFIETAAMRTLSQ